MWFDVNHASQVTNNNLIEFPKRFQDDYHRTLRRTIMRYINLSHVLVFRLVSSKVRDRFPTYRSLVDAGLMLPDEEGRLQAIDNRLVVKR